jgi:hypothetical protein
MMAWGNYIRLMRLYPTLESEKTIRGLFKRGINILKEHASKVGLSELWIEWEKKFGSIQSVD